MVSCFTFVRGPINLEFQGHGLHHGGQLYSAGVPVTNNRVMAFGARLAGGLPLLGVSSLGVFRLTSLGRIDPVPEPNRPDRGRGAYVRGSISPRGWVELFAIQWWGQDFLSEEGDNSYNSRGTDRQYYKPRRRYQEYGFARRIAIESGVTLDAEFRFHQFDDLRSIAVGHPEWEYSYPLVIHAPFRGRTGKSPPALSRVLALATRAEVASRCEAVAVATHLTGALAPQSAALQRSGPGVLSNQSRYEAVRVGGLNHLYHHRAQLTTYLRLNEKPVPSLYGPSADEAYPGAL